MCGIEDLFPPGFNSAWCLSSRSIEGEDDAADSFFSQERIAQICDFASEIGTISIPALRRGRPLRSTLLMASNSMDELDSLITADVEIGVKCSLVSTVMLKASVSTLKLKRRLFAESSIARTNSDFELCSLNKSCSNDQ